MAKLYAAYIAGAWQSLQKNMSLNCQLISNSVIQIHSFCLVRSFLLALLWTFFILMGGKADGQDLFLTKTIGFDFLLFNYMLPSACSRVQTFNSNRTIYCNAHAHRYDLEISWWLSSSNGFSV